MTPHLLAGRVSFLSRCLKKSWRSHCHWNHGHNQYCRVHVFLPWCPSRSTRLYVLVNVTSWWNASQRQHSCIRSHFPWCPACSWQSWQMSLPYGEGSSAGRRGCSTLLSLAPVLETQWLRWISRRGNICFQASTTFSISVCDQMFWLTSIGAGSQQIDNVLVMTQVAQDLQLRHQGLPLIWVGIRYKHIYQYQPTILSHREE